jgi:hypothetical protein
VTRLTFDHALVVGGVGQECVTRECIDDRWSVEELHEMRAHDGHGPRLRTDGDGVTEPDLRISKHGVSPCLEVKTKRGLTNGLLSGQPEHGIDRKCYDEMLDYQRRMGTRVYLVVVELFEIVGRPNPGDRMYPTEPKLFHVTKTGQTYTVDDDEIDVLRQWLRHHGGFLVVPVDQLRVRIQDDNRANSMVYFPRSQMRSDWIQTLNRSVAAKNGHDIRRGRGVA